jgi:tetratricopeptide (TPR) repeat protein
MIHPKEEERVRVLLARGTTKSAVEEAKGIHKRHQSPASEALLVEAYAARIQSLLHHSLTAEAKALHSMVLERYGCARRMLADIGVMLAGCQNGIEELVRPLNDPAASAELRAGIEDILKRQVTDLSLLAQCRTLSPTHPLRIGAQALQSAFNAVTSGSVTDDALLLPQVPRRGALGPWKMLVRAMAYFYRREDAACERCLEGVDPDSVPARLVPAMRAMLSESLDQPLQPASVALTRQLGGDSKVLRGALESLDTVFSRKKKRAHIFQSIQEAVSACQKARPEMLKRLRQHISVRAATLELPVEKVKGALGGSSTKDAYFWRLFARSMESRPEPQLFAACSMWEQFRHHAVAEGWFPEKGPEVAAIYLHIARLLEHIPSEELAAVRPSFIAQFAGYVSETPTPWDPSPIPDKRDCYFLFPGQLFERACAVDPHREAFEQWVEWAERERNWKEAERAATSWRRALPQESRPLLYLMEAAENRGALTKAFKYLEEAEKLDSLNPEVRRAALRLLVAQAMRHLRQRKAHLVEQDLATLEPLPQGQEGDRPAFIAALRWTCCVVRGDADAASNAFTKVVALLQSSQAALLACSGVGEACGFRQTELNGYLPPSSRLGERARSAAEALRRALNAVLDQKDDPDKAGSLAAAVARACALGDDMRVPFIIPLEWERAILKELSGRPERLDVRELRALGDAALRRDRRELAYAASTAGLARGSDAEGRFLLLRARALPEWEFPRRAECIAAAAELGRRRRDMDLVDEAVEMRRGGGSRRPTFFDLLDEVGQSLFSITPERLNKVLKREKESTKFPTYSPEAFRPYGKGPLSQDDWDEDDDDDEPESRELEQFGELLDELQQALEGKIPKNMPRPRRRRNMPPDFEDQGDLPF